MDIAMENRTHKVKDLNVASFLLASDEVKLTKTERRLDGTVFFHFTPLAKVENLIRAYWADTAPSIQPRKLFGSQRDLKDILFSGGKNYG